MLWSRRSLGFSASPVPPPPPQAPGSPGACWEPGLGSGPGCWGGGGRLPSPSSPPLPDSGPRRRVRELGKEGRGLRAAAVVPSPGPHLPPSAPAPFPPLHPPRQVATPALGPFSNHPQRQTWPRAARRREGGKEKGGEAGVRAEGRGVAGKGCQRPRRERRRWREGGEEGRREAETAGGRDRERERQRDGRRRRRGGGEAEGKAEEGAERRGGDEAGWGRWREGGRRERRGQGRGLLGCGGMWRPGRGRPGGSAHGSTAGGPGRRRWGVGRHVQDRQLDGGEAQARTLGPGLGRVGAGPSHLPAGLGRVSCPLGELSLLTCRMGVLLAPRCPAWEMSEAWGVAGARG